MAQLDKPIRQINICLNMFDTEKHNYIPNYAKLNLTTLILIHFYCFHIPLQCCMVTEPVTRS
jgi:hypothetical protein